MGMGKLAVPPPRPTFVFEQGEQQVALAKVLKRWGQKLMRCNAAEVRCDSMTCHPWLIGRGETKLGQEEIHLEN